MRPTSGLGTACWNNSRATFSKCLSAALIRSSKSLLATTRSESSWPRRRLTRMPVRREPPASVALHHPRHLGFQFLESSREEVVCRLNPDQFLGRRQALEEGFHFLSRPVLVMGALHE